MGLKESELERIRRENTITEIIRKANDYRPSIHQPKYLSYTDPAPKPKPTEKTFLYIMRNNRNGYFKVGHSTKPKHREKTLQAEDPDITLLYQWECHKTVESKVHRNFKTNRLRGEWFRFTDSQMLDVLKFINELIYE